MSYQLELAEAAQREGIAKVSDHNKAWLTEARAVARRVCELSGTVTADDVRNKMTTQPNHPSAYGAIFRVGFKWTGQFVKSEHVSAHCRVVRVWELL